jgi:hypothetical protein
MRSLTVTGNDSLQASLRNLVLDVTPGEQLQAANAWHGRFNHVGNVVGFAMGTSAAEKDWLHF